jgi:hypothetical protein
VASFSGAPDIDYNPLVAVGATAVIQATAVGLNGTEPDAMFGSRVTNEINWQGHDPAGLVTNLANTDVWLFTATGANGPLDSAAPNPAGSGIEALTHGSTMSFVQRAQQLGVPFHLVNYMFGTHSWGYWARDLREYIGPLMLSFAHPSPAPTTVSYQSVEQRWSAWGWTVSFERSAPQQLAVLTGADAKGFTLQGSGTATVVTPASYAPGQMVTVSRSGAGTASVMADEAGRLHLTVPLGGPALPAAVAGAAVIGVPGVPPPAATTTVTIVA